MTDDDKPSAFDDVRKGLGLLFRAAKTTVEKLPTKDLEDVVVTSAREVGRALENVGKTIEREVLGTKPPTSPSRSPSPQPAPAAEAAKPDGEPPPEEPRGPRVG